MSAYIVDDKTINKVIAYFYFKSRTCDFYWLAERLAEQGFDVETQEDREALGNAMFRLNVSAVEQRYTGSAEQFRPLNYRYERILPPTIYGAYKALQCWRYQCSEGNVPRHWLYKLMSDIRNGLAITIAEQTDQYKSAGWE